MELGFTVAGFQSVRSLSTFTLSDACASNSILLLLHAKQPIIYLLPKTSYPPHSSAAGIYPIPGCYGPSYEDMQLSRSKAAASWIFKSRIHQLPYYTNWRTAYHYCNQYHCLLPHSKPNLSRTHAQYMPTFVK
jgi:hypothetical protein